jgi:hypothetical protein
MADPYMDRMPSTTGCNYLRLTILILCSRYWDAAMLLHIELARHLLTFKQPNRYRIMPKTFLYFFKRFTGTNEGLFAKSKKWSVKYFQI